MICKHLILDAKFSAYLLIQSGVSAEAGTTGKDLANFRNEATLLENRL